MFLIGALAMVFFGLSKGSIFIPLESKTSQTSYVFCIQCMISLEVSRFFLVLEMDVSFSQAFKSCQMHEERGTRNVHAKLHN